MESLGEVALGVKPDRTVHDPAMRQDDHGRRPAAPFTNIPRPLTGMVGSVSYRAIKSAINDRPRKDSANRPSPAHSNHPVRTPTSSPLDSWSRYPSFHCHNRITARPKTGRETRENRNRPMIIKGRLALSEKAWGGRRRGWDGCRRPKVSTGMLYRAWKRSRRIPLGHNLA